MKYENHIRTEEIVGAIKKIDERVNSLNYERDPVQVEFASSSCGSCHIKAEYFSNVSAAKERFEAFRQQEVNKLLADKENLIKELETL